MISRARLRWQELGKRALTEKRSANKDAHSVAGREHMQTVDCFDGKSTRTGKEIPEDGHQLAQDLIEIKPEVDGRLKDIGRSKL